MLKRLIRKDTFLTRQEWRDPVRWEGDVRDPQAKVPWEIACHYALNGVPNLDHVVALRGNFRRTLMNFRNLSYTLYMAWCQHGDLDEVIAYHAIPQPDFPPPRAIPEAMIWYVAECLVECGIALHEGDRNVPNPDWAEVVHR